jgi:hypothetical protein
MSWDLVLGFFPEEVQSLSAGAKIDHEAPRERGFVAV